MSFLLNTQDIKRKVDIEGANYWKSSTFVLVLNTKILYLVAYEHMLSRNSKLTIHYNPMSRTHWVIIVAFTGFPRV